MFIDRMSDSRRNSIGLKDVKVNNRYVKSRVEKGDKLTDSKLEIKKYIKKRMKT